MGDILLVFYFFVLFHVVSHLSYDIAQTWNTQNQANREAGWKQNDEIDAVFRKRIDSEDSGSITGNLVVNQLLAKLDGVHSLPNVLMIGMTNRRELLDPALLRPGRLEVQIEIPLPDREARREILQIHFGALRRRNRLSYLLRCAIDGIAPSLSGVPRDVVTTPPTSFIDEPLATNPKRGKK